VIQLALHLLELLHYQFVAARQQQGRCSLFLLGILIVLALLRLLIVLRRLLLRLGLLHLLLLLYHLLFPDDHAAPVLYLCELVRLVDAVGADHVELLLLALFVLVIDGCHFVVNGFFAVALVAELALLEKFLEHGTQLGLDQMMAVHLELINALVDAVYIALFAL